MLGKLQADVYKHLLFLLMRWKQKSLTISFGHLQTYSCC